MIELASNLGYAMIDRMLGGQGVPLDKSREFSDIELAIIEKIIVVSVRLLREPWKNVLEVSPVLERVETNPQFAQIIAPSEMISIVTLSIKVGEVEGLMNICLPYLTLEDIMDKLNTKYWYSATQRASEESYTEEIESMVRRIRIPVIAKLGTSSISVSDFVNLQLGDVIRLDTKVEDELKIYVGNIKKFTALPGASKDAYAVRVTSVIREEE